MNNSEMEIMNAISSVEQALETLSKYDNSYLATFMNSWEQWTEFDHKVSSLEDKVWKIKNAFELMEEEQEQER